MISQSSAAYSDIGQVRPHLQSHDWRETTRWRLNLPAQVNHSSGMKLSGVMKNLSESGCLLLFQNKPPLVVSRFYCIKFDGVEMLGAYAIWIRESAAGFLFASRLHPAIVEHTARSSDIPSVTAVNTQEPLRAFHDPISEAKAGSNLFSVI